MFDHISKHLKGRQKRSAARCMFNSLLGVTKYGQTRVFMFDILLQREKRNVVSPSGLVMFYLLHKHNEIPNHSTFAVYGSTCHGTVGTVIISHASITCHDVIFSCFGLSFFL